jgi:hypothetical protein
LFASLFSTATRSQILRDGGIKAVTCAHAHRAMEVARREIKKVFTTIDVLVMQTMKGTAPLIGSSAGGINTSQFGLVRATRDLSAVWIFECGSADRIANRRRALERSDRPRARARVRTGDRAAAAKAEAVKDTAVCATLRQRRQRADEN